MHDFLPVRRGSFEKSWQSFEEEFMLAEKQTIWSGSLILVWSCIMRQITFRNLRSVIRFRAFPIMTRKCTACHKSQGLNFDHLSGIRENCSYQRSSRRFNSHARQSKDKSSRKRKRSWLEFFIIPSFSILNSMDLDLSLTILFRLLQSI